MKLLYDPRPFLGADKREAMKKLTADTVPDRDFYLLVIGAVLLAGSGIFLDSIPVLIASMIVAPLAPPILLLALAFVVGDGRLVARSIAMQQFLINAGVYPEALVTGYFGSLTQAALRTFQQQQNITPSSGYFGPRTKKRILDLIPIKIIQP